MRTLVRWSETSLMNTTPRPCSAEPSRRMLHSLHAVVRCRVFEIAGVDRIQARFLDREAKQPPAGRDRRCRGLRAHVAIGGEAVAVWTGLLHPAHAGNTGKPLGQPLPFRLDVNVES